MTNTTNLETTRAGELKRGISLASLKLSPSMIRVLNANGIRCLEDLKGITFKELNALPGLRKKTMSDIIRYTERAFVEPMTLELFDETQKIPKHVADINLLVQDLTVRLRNVLSVAKLPLIRDVLPYSEAVIKSLPNMGIKTLTELKDYLASKGIVWGGVSYTIDESFVHANQKTQPVIQIEDKSLPEYFYNRFSVRAQNFLKKANIDSCVKLIKLQPEIVLDFKNAGRQTWYEIEKIKPDVVRFLNDGTYWYLDFQKYASYEQFLAGFLSSFRPYPKCDLIFDHRLSIRGSGKDKTLEETAKCLKVTRERIRQIETKVRKHYFGTAGRTIIQSFLTLARETMLSFSGATNPEKFAKKIDELAGWSPATIPNALINFLTCFEVMNYDKHRNILIVPDFYKITYEINNLFLRFCLDPSRLYSAIGYDDFLEYLKDYKELTLNPISFEAYKIWGYDLLGKNILPADKKHQLKAFISGCKEFKASEIGDKRKASTKLLDVLRNSKKALTFEEWKKLANHTFPGENFTTNQIRGLCSQNSEQIVNYNRGCFIWHEYVSIPSSLVMKFETQLLEHMNKYGVEVISIYRIFKENQKTLLATCIPNQSLLYFLLKRNSQNQINYPEYPKVSLPNAEGGDGAFSRILKNKLFKRGGVTLNELNNFFANVLCADKRFALATPGLKRLGGLYYLESDTVIEQNEIVRVCDDFKQEKIFQAIQPATQDDWERIETVLRDRFASGFRIHSEIDFQRFTNYFRDTYKCDIPFEDFTFYNIVEAIGIRHSGKIFIPSSQDKSRLSDLIAKAFETGANTIFYEPFFELHNAQLAELRIYSANMLKDYLVGIKNDLYFETDFCSLEHSETPLDEIVRCFHGEEKILSWETIAAKHPYIPASKIRSLLYNSYCFIPISKTGNYIHSAYIDITDDDRHKAMDFIEERLRNADYISVQEYDVSELLERNQDLSETTIRRHLFRHCCDVSFKRTGDIIYKIGNKIDAIDILKTLFANRNEITFKEIEIESQKLLGRKNQTFLRVANNMMVRVSRELFVSDKAVSFNVSQIDSLLERICTGEYISLQDVKSFSCFPYPGYAWNSYLLASYLRRFSVMFRFDTLSDVSTCGAIVRRDAIFTNYNQILVDVLAKSNINLVDIDSIDFLFVKGYITKSVLSNVADLIEAARVKRGV